MRTIKLAAIVSIVCTGSALAQDRSTWNFADGSSYRASPEHYILGLTPRLSEAWLSIGTRAASSYRDWNADRERQVRLRMDDWVVRLRQDIQSSCSLIGPAWVPSSSPELVAPSAGSLEPISYGAFVRCSQEYTPVALQLLRANLSSASSVAAVLDHRNRLEAHLQQTRSGRLNGTSDGLYCGRFLGPLSGNVNSPIDALKAHAVLSQVAPCGAGRPHAAWVFFWAAFSQATPSPYQALYVSAWKIAALKVFLRGPNATISIRSILSTLLQEYPRMPESEVFADLDTRVNEKISSMPAEMICSFTEVQ